MTGLFLGIDQVISQRSNVSPCLFANSLTSPSLPNLVLCASIDSRWVLCDQSWCQQVGMIILQWNWTFNFQLIHCSYHCRMECLPTPLRGHALPLFYSIQKLKVSIFKGHIFSNIIWHVHDHKMLSYLLWVSYTPLNSGELHYTYIGWTSNMVACFGTLSKQGDPLLWNYEYSKTRLTMKKHTILPW